MAPKVKDIADKLGVSPATVSLVLNNRPGISQATRERVLQAVQEMGGEALIQAPAEKRTLLFLVYHKSLASEGSTYFSQLFADIIQGVENQARVLGFNVMVFYIDRQSLRQQADAIDSTGVHGVLLLATDMEEEQIERFARIKPPLVVVDNYWDDRELDCVTINNARGVFQAVRHLADMGHRRVGYLHVLRNANNFNERHHAFSAPLSTSGWRPDPTASTTLDFLGN